MPATPALLPATGDRRRAIADRRDLPRGGRRQTDPCIRTACDTVGLSLSEQLGEHIYRHGLSYARAAQMAGVSEQGLADILKIATDPKVSTLVRLARALKCEVKITLLPTHPTGVGQNR
jgi:Helix-turn-helix